MSLREAEIDNNLGLLQRGWRFFSEIILIRSDRPTWTPAIVWTTGACISVAFAVFVALRLDRLHDLHEVRGWLQYWMSHRGNPYDQFNGDLDYPPVAFLILWPLGLPSDATVAFWYIPAALAATGLAAWAMLRWMRERMYVTLSTAETVALIALMFAGAGSRSGLWQGQTMALSLMCGALAIRWSRSRPFAAGIALAFCSFKPHIAVGFGLAILVIEGTDVLVIAAAIVLSLSLLFAATVGQPLTEIIADYARNLTLLYAGEERVRGLLSIRFVLDDLIGWYALSTILYALLAISTLVVIVVLARRRRHDAVTQAEVAVCCLLWSLMFLPHQLYNSLLAAPALWLLMWPEAGLIRRHSWRVAATAAYVLFGVFDVAGAMRLVGTWMPDLNWLYTSSYYLSPLRIAAIFALILWGLYHRPHINTQHTGVRS